MFIIKMVTIYNNDNLTAEIIQALPIVDEVDKLSDFDELEEFIAERYQSAYAIGYKSYDPIHDDEKHYLVKEV